MKVVLFYLHTRDLCACRAKKKNAYYDYIIDQTVHVAFLWEQNSMQEDTGIIVFVSSSDVWHTVVSSSDV